VLFLLLSRSTHAIAEFFTHVFLESQRFVPIGGFDVPKNIGQQEVPKNDLLVGSHENDIARSLRLKFNT